MNKERLKIKNLPANARIFIFALAGLAAICSSSCQQNDRRKDAAKIVEEWTGREIRFPEGLPCHVAGKEALPEYCDG
jgi:hypothetical protein